MNRFVVFLFLIFSLLPYFIYAEDSFKGWLNWRGPELTGVSTEKNIPTKISLEKDSLLWKLPIKGRGTPVSDGKNLFVLGYVGEQEDLSERIYSIDTATGKINWELSFKDYLSDVIYDRYAIGSPVIDAETGQIYVLLTSGQLVCVSQEGKILWQISMAEEYGRNTYPNGRTGSPIVVGHRVIIHSVTNTWGEMAPPSDRIYAFDKISGQLIWISTPGRKPPELKDSSFSSPVVGDYKGEPALFYSTGCGNVVCINLNSGKPIWRYRLLFGGMNSNLLLYKNDSIIAVHGKENLDSTKAGRMLSIDINCTSGEIDEGKFVFDKKCEKWRNDDVCAFSSSPVLNGNRIYQTEDSGNLLCIDADSGKLNWQLKIGNTQIHASPSLVGDVLYVPMNDGLFYIIRDKGLEAEILSKVQLEGNCLGAPCLVNGYIFVFTNQSLYAFGSNVKQIERKYTYLVNQSVEDVEAKYLEMTPAEVDVYVGSTQKFTLFALNKKGQRIKQVDPKEIKFSITPYGPGKSILNGEVLQNEYKAPMDSSYSFGVIQAEWGELKARARIRVMPLELSGIDFEEYKLKDDQDKQDLKYQWHAAGKRWEIVKKDGSNVLAKTIDNLILQRAVTFIGPSDLNHYILEADVCSDGNRRVMSDVGLINQRYQVVLRGNSQLIEVSSNIERFKKELKFKWKPETWYTMKTLVDHDGTKANIHVKVWERGGEEPKDWSFQVSHDQGHKNGAPGIYGFSLNDLKAVYIDNIKYRKSK